MERIILEQIPVKTVYAEGDKLYKVFVPGYNKADILNEALNQARVEECGINIPKLQEVKMIDGCWALVMDFIPGENMQVIMDKNPDKEDELLERFVNIQLNIQSKRCRLLNRHWDKMNRKIDETDLPATLRYDLHNRVERMPKLSELCHGDYNPSNVIITPDDEAYVVDWAHVTQGNGEADAARTFMLFTMAGENVRAKKYINIYCEKVGKPLSDILRWLPVLATSQSVKHIDSQKAFLNRLAAMDTQELREFYEQI
ncbi:MAG: phosphotransferase [Erysipelotrichaceae bacterium]|nr:phosphotransferase [Erysipelotrichaceae bacterium]MBQ4252702.1 phosphotransferase [Erysipelotrichaceae bacterium]